MTNPVNPSSAAQSSIISTIQRVLFKRKSALQNWHKTETIHYFQATDKGVYFYLEKNSEEPKWRYLMTANKVGVNKNDLMGTSKNSTLG